MEDIARRLLANAVLTLAKTGYGGRGFHRDVFLGYLDSSIVSKVRVLIIDHKCNKLITIMFAVCARSWRGECASS